MTRLPTSHITSLARSTALFAALFGGLSCAGELTVTLHGIRAQTGLVRISVVDSQDAWDGKAEPVQVGGAPPQGQGTKFTFKALEPGSYAVMITHDENGNGKLDTNLVGMPLEGYGFSNNPKVMRKPTWQEARFVIGEADTDIDVELR